METQPQLLLLQKSMVVIEGVTRELHPEINIWELAKPLISSWAMEHLGPKGKTQRLLKDTKHYIHAWMQLPNEINAHFAQLHRRFPERQTGINLLDLLPTLAVLLGGVLAGVFWTDAWSSPPLLSSAALIVLGLWLQWRK